ncbi:PAPA-1-like conserved region domain-containing protein [Trichoderma evansii]
MSSRPRRSAAAKAKEVISVHARWADMSEKEDIGTTMSSRRTGRGAASRDTASSPEETHSSVTVKLPTSKPRQSTRGGNRRGADAFEGGEIVLGKRNRGAKKSYVIDSSPDDEDEDEEDEVEVEDDDEDDEDEDEDDMRADDDDEMEEIGDEDAEGEDEMDVDAEGEDDMVVAPKTAGRPSAKNSRSTKPRPTVKVTNSRANRDEDEDEEDDDELSDPADSDIGDDTIVYGNRTMGDDEDAEGEEIEVAGDEDDIEEEEEEEEEDEEDEDDEMTMAPGANGDSDLDSEEGSRAETPDLAKMTKRQRARFEDIPQEFMKLPDEIQVKKVFTAEELSMRRQEMARRRRNLSEKRNEEVKMETINKLLKKQAPKINRKAAAAAAAADSQDPNAQKPDPVFIRWVSNKSGSRIAVPDEIVEGPSGILFGGKTQQSSAVPPKLVTEVA